MSTHRCNLCGIISTHHLHNVRVIIKCNSRYLFGISSEFHELTCIGGTTKRHEDLIKGLEREIQEETCELLPLPNMFKSLPMTRHGPFLDSFQKHTKTKTMTFRVYCFYYFIDLSLYHSALDRLPENFQKRTPRNKAMRELKALVWLSLEELEHIMHGNHSLSFFRRDQDVLRTILIRPFKNSN